MAFVNDSFWDNGPRPGSFHATVPRPMGAAAHVPITHTTCVAGAAVVVTLDAVMSLRFVFVGALHLEKEHVAAIALPASR
jgi:hypothetical protein